MDIYVNEIRRQQGLPDEKLLPSGRRMVAGSPPFFRNENNLFFGAD